MAGEPAATKDESSVALLGTKAPGGQPAPHASLNGETEIVVYGRRWYILAVYSLLAFIQGWQWGVPGGISISLEGIYGIDDYTIQFLLNYGPIFCIPFVPVFAWWLDQPGGLRKCTLTGYALMLGGALCRGFALNAAKWSIALLHLGCIFNAIAGPVAMGCVSKLSEHWFPAKQRGLATAIAAEANLLGSAMAFAVGPAMVKDASVRENTIYNALVGGIVLVGLIACVLYYPSRPPKPPSISAAAHADVAFGVGTMCSSMRLLFRNRAFIVIALAYGLCNGMSGSWASTLDLNLQTLITDKGQAQTTGGWVSFTTTIAGNFGGLAVGGIVDRFRNHKLVMVSSLFLAGAFYAWFALLSQHLLPTAWNSGPAAVVQVFISATAGGFFLNSMIPVMFELAVEATYPLVPEGVVIMLMTGFSNTSSLALLFVPISSATAAFNWILVGTVIAMATMTGLFLTSASRRYKVDAGLATVQEEADEAAAEVAAKGLGAKLLSDHDGEGAGHARSGAERAISLHQASHGGALLHGGHSLNAPPGTTLASSGSAPRVGASSFLDLDGDLMGVHDAAVVVPATEAPGLPASGVPGRRRPSMR